MTSLFSISPLEKVFNEKAEKKKKRKRTNELYIFHERNAGNYFNVSFGAKCNKKEIVEINVLPRVRACLRACLVSSFMHLGDPGSK